MRLLQDFVEGKPLAEKFVAAYCLGSWLPEAMFLGEGTPFRQVFSECGNYCLVGQHTQTVNLRIVSTTKPLGRQPRGKSQVLG